MEDNKGLKITLIILIILTIIVFAGIAYLYFFKEETPKEDKITYSAKAQAVIEEYNIKPKEYSKTLETILEEDLYNSDY